MFLASNDTKNSLTLYMAQKLIDRSTAENVVTVTCSDLHLYSPDTDVLLLALRRVPQLGTNPAVIMGTGERRQRVMLRPMYDQLGADKASALVNWHALTECDTTGYI